MTAEDLLRYFPGLTDRQMEQFSSMEALYTKWNSKINVISRKDMDSFYERHVLHSLAIAKAVNFRSGSDVLDVGTGGGFPGIPLAVFYPDVQFTLVDSIGKKIKVVDEVAEALGLKNVKAIHGRAESVDGPFDFIVSRAVTRVAEFLPWVKGKIKPKNVAVPDSGYLFLKGGDLAEELSTFPKARVYPLIAYFEEAFFETKYMVYLRAI